MVGGKGGCTFATVKCLLLVVIWQFFLCGFNFSCSWRHCIQISQIRVWSARNDATSDKWVLPIIKCTPVVKSKHDLSWNSFENCSGSHKLSNEWMLNMLFFNLLLSFNSVFQLVTFGSLPKAGSVHSAVRIISVLPVSVFCLSVRRNQCIYEFSMCAYLFTFMTNLLTCTRSTEFSRLRCLH